MGIRRALCAKYLHNEKMSGITEKKTRINLIFLMF